MMRLRRACRGTGAAIAAGAIACALAAAGAGPARAAAGIGPRLSFYLPQTRIDAGSRLPFSFHLIDAPRQMRAYLQRRVGPHRWVLVAALPRHAGRRYAPARPMGRYGYRIAVYDGHRLAGASGAITTYVYGPVSAAQLCAGGGAAFTGGCSAGTVGVGGQPFSFDSIDTNANSSYAGRPALVAHDSSCRQATIVYAVSDNSRATGDVYADVEQTAAFQQAGRTSRGSVGLVSATLTSPNWDLVFFVDSGRPAIFWNGTFECWTADGRF